MSRDLAGGHSLLVATSSGRVRVTVAGLTISLLVNGRMNPEGFQDIVKSRMFSVDRQMDRPGVAFRGSGPMMVGILLCAGLDAFEGTSYSASRSTWIHLCTCIEETSSSAAGRPETHQMSVAQQVRES